MCRAQGLHTCRRLGELVAESDRVAVHGHRNFNRTNAYFTQDHPNLSQSHPLRRFYDRSNAFVLADNFGANSILRAIYEWSVAPNAHTSCMVGYCRFT